MKKKLIIFDLNGVLIDRKFEPTKLTELPKYTQQIGNHIVLKLEHIDFEELCKYYDIAVWSCMKPYNIHKMLYFIFGKYRNKLIFVYSQSECTISGEKIPGQKPIFLKEAYKITSMFKYLREDIIIIDDTKEKIKPNTYGKHIQPNEYKKGYLFDYLIFLQRKKKYVNN